MAFEFECLCRISKYCSVQVCCASFYSIVLNVLHCCSQVTFNLRFSKKGMYSLLVYSKLIDDMDKPDLEASIAGYLFQVGRRTLFVYSVLYCTVLYPRTIQHTSVFSSKFNLI